MKAGRIPCINPNCKRTASAEKFSCDIICGKCFRGLPAEMRAKHRGYWRKIRYWERRIVRTSDELKRQRMHAIVDQLTIRLNHHWHTEIKATFSGEKPEGIDAFLEELGL